MRNELAQEYNLPDIDEAQVRLEFLSNTCVNAWLVEVWDEKTNKYGRDTGGTPRQAYARAYSAFIKDEDES